MIGVSCPLEFPVMGLAPYIVKFVFFSLTSHHFESAILAHILTDSTMTVA